METDRLVITGAGLICSLGNTPLDVWNALTSGESGVKPIGGFDPSGFPCTFAAQGPSFDPSDLGIDARDSRIMDTPAYLLMKCTQDAFVASGLAQTSIPREEIAFFAALGMVDYQIDDLLPAVAKSLNPSGELDYPSFYSRGYNEIHPLWPLSMLNNISFCQVARSLNLQGENTVFSPHADSGAMAVAEGMKSVLDGRAQVALCSGVSEKISLFSLARLHLSGTLNTADSTCRPFDRERHGILLGEGCGTIVLELHSSAEKRGATGLASLTGYGFACERGDVFSGPTPRAIRLAMEEALGRAGAKPSEVDLVIAHAEGSVAADRNEIEALHQLFSSVGDGVHVFSSKGAIGHLLAGAPLADLILGIFMAREGLIPRTLGASTPEMDLRLRLVYKEPVRKRLKRVLINAQSCEGQAASLLLEAV